MLKPLLHFSIVLTIAHPIGLPAAESAPGTNDDVFALGERLEYDLSWGIFKVGSAVLQIDPPTVWRGESCRGLHLRVRTNGFADKFYKVRSRFESYVSEDFSRTLYYKKVQREGDTNRDIEVFFDWEKLTATYVKHEDGRTESAEPISLPGPVHDPLGALFGFRAGHPRIGPSYPLRITDGKKIIDLAVTAESDEKIKVEAGTFRTLRFVPDTGDLAGVFKKSDDSRIFIWFDQNTPHAPVQVRGKVAVGSFFAKLESSTAVADPPIRNPQSR